MTSTTEPIPLHNDPNSAYHGPTMGYLIAHNLLGHQIIKSFADRPIDGDILDNEELARLREYVRDPSPSGTQKFLEKNGFVDAPGAEKGERADKVYGSLVGYAIARGGLSEGEIEALRAFFERPEIVRELEGVVPRVITREEREANMASVE